MGILPLGIVGPHGVCDSEIIGNQLYLKTSDSISRNEMRVIFGHFDIDNDGEISFEGNNSSYN